MENLFTGLIASKTRIKLLVRFFFNPQTKSYLRELLTGRENIYINGSIMGLKKKEIDQKFDSIVEFAELGDFIDTPVSYYSYGMFVRLGFPLHQVSSLIYFF